MRTEYFVGAAAFFLGWIINPLWGIRECPNCNEQFYSSLAFIEREGTGERVIFFTPQPDLASVAIVGQFRRGTNRGMRELPSPEFLAIRQKRTSRYRRPVVGKVGFQNGSPQSASNVWPVRFIGSHSR